MVPEGFIIAHLEATTESLGYLSPGEFFVLTNGPVHPAEDPAKLIETGFWETMDAAGGLHII